MKIRNRFALELALPRWISLVCGADPENDDAGGGGGEMFEQEPGADLSDDIVGAMDELRQGGGVGGENDQGAPGGGVPRDEGGRFAKRDGDGKDPGAGKDGKDPAGGGQKREIPRTRRPGDPPVQQQQQGKKPAGGDQGAGKGGQGGNGKDAAGGDGGGQGKAAPDGWAPTWLKPADGFDPKAIPAPLRQQLFAREQAVGRYVRETGERAKAWEPVEKALAPIAAHLKTQNSSPAAFVGNLLQVENWLHSDSGAEKPSFEPLAWLAENYYGMPLGDLIAEIQAGTGNGKGGAGGGAKGSAALDPVVTDLKKTVDGLRGRLDQREQSERDARKTALRAEWSDFQDKHPDAKIPEVVKIMQGLIAGGQARSYSEALEQASWLHPPTRAKLQQKQQREDAERARTAAISPRRMSPAAGARTGSSGSESAEDSVRATLAEL